MTVSETFLKSPQTHQAKSRLQREKELGRLNWAMVVSLYKQTLGLAEGRDPDGIHNMFASELIEAILEKEYPTPSQTSAMRC